MSNLCFFRAVGSYLQQCQMNSEQIVNNDESSENNENNIKKIKESYTLPCTTGAIHYFKHIFSRTKFHQSFLVLALALIFIDLSLSIFVRSNYV